MGIGVQELLVILFIVLILFGAKKVPELARGLGKALSEFKKAAKDIDIETDDSKSANANLESVNFDVSKDEEPSHKA